MGVAGADDLAGYRPMIICELLRSPDAEDISGEDDIQVIDGSPLEIIEQYSLAGAHDTRRTPVMKLCRLPAWRLG